MEEVSEQNKKTIVDEICDSIVHGGSDSIVEIRIK